MVINNHTKTSGIPKQLLQSYQQNMLDQQTPTQTGG